MVRVACRFGLTLFVVEPDHWSRLAALARLVDSQSLTSIRTVLIRKRLFASDYVSLLVEKLIRQLESGDRLWGERNTQKSDDAFEQSSFESLNLTVLWNELFIPVFHSNFLLRLFHSKKTLEIPSSRKQRLCPHRRCLQLNARRDDGTHTSLIRRPNKTAASRMRSVVGS